MRTVLYLSLIHIYNERWQNTPFLIRTGKKLNKREMEVVITFKAPFPNVEPNVLIIKIQPTEGVYVRFNIKMCIRDRAMAGEDEESDEKDELDIPFERTLNGIKPWKQVIVMAAGAFMNVLLAWLIFIGITACQGLSLIHICTGW